MSRHSSTPAEQRSARGKFTTAAGSLADSGTLSAALNDFARASAQIFPATTSDAAQIPYGKLATSMGEAQARSASPESAKFDARISSGEDEAEFIGYETQPQLQVAVGFFGPQVTGCHATGLILRLDFSLYAVSLSHLTNIPVTNIVETIRQVVRRLVTYWREKVYPTFTEKEKADVLKVHERNMAPLKILDSILAASDPHEVQGLDKLVKAVPMVYHTVISMIVNKLSQPNGNFWASFLSLTSSFGLVYAPELGGADQNGSLVSIRTALKDATDREDLDGVSFQGSIQTPEVPITHVLVSKVPSPAFYRAHDDNKLLPTQVTRTSIRYPSDQDTGKAYYAPVPEFLAPVFQSIGREMTIGNSLIPGKARDGQEKLKMLFIGQIDAVHEFLKGYARSVFHAVQLQGSVTNMAVPLSLDWEVGKAYRVGIAGEPMFIGVLASTSHTVASRQGSPVASTQLSFSHVQWGSYRVTD